MRSHAKASSAVPGCSVERTRSDRGARARFVVLALALIALLAFAPVARAQVVVNGFGFTKPGAENLGGAFGSFFGPLNLGLAANSSGNGAAQETVYVAGSFSNRIQRFSPSGEFERAWGFDAIATTKNERQRFVLDASGGTYRLSFKGQSTSPIPYDTSFLQLINIYLPELPTVGSGNISGFGADCGELSTSYCIFDFFGALAATNLPQLTVDTSALVGSARVETLVNGASAAETGGTDTGFEICTIANNCPGNFNFAEAANGGQVRSPQGVAIDQASGDAYVTEEGNSRVSEFDADGNFIRTFGWDVISSGKPNDNGTGYEVCDTTNGNVAADCKTASFGSNGGQFAGGIGFPLFDSSGNLWVPDPSNRRIQEFDADGNFIAAYGYNVDALGGSGGLEECTSTASGACQAGTQGNGAGQFGFGGPTQIAFDDAGNLFAIDKGNSRLQKFNPTLTSASVFGASALAPYTTQAPEALTATVGGTRLQVAVKNNLTASPAESQIIELDPSDGSVEGTSLVGSKVISIRGLAPGAGSGFYASAVVPIPATTARIFELGPSLPDLSTTMFAVEDKTATTAVLSGSVNPNGAWTGGCKFQYSTDQSNWTDVLIPNCESLDPNGGPQEVSAKATGLDPDTHYFVRLQASRPLVTGSTVNSFTKNFDTEAPAPILSTVGAVEVNDKSARLVATIDPRNSSTAYSFEYGTTPGLGSSTALVNIGGGTDPVIVSQAVTGLLPDTTYYFRVRATNLTGTTESGSETLHTRTAPFDLPDDRAWEMVTPPEKNYTDPDNMLSFGEKNASISINGDAVAFCSTALFGEPATQMASGCGSYLSRRHANGWQTTMPFPRYCKVDSDTGEVEGALMLIPSADLSHMVHIRTESEGCSIPPLDPAAPLPQGRTSWNTYRQDLVTDPASFNLLGRRGVSTGTGIGGVAPAFPLNGSTDFSSVVFASFENQTGAPEETGDFRKLYDWREEGKGGCTQSEGCLSLLSRDVDNESFTTDSSLPLMVLTQSRYVDSAVSSDGDRVYFQNPVPNTHSLVDSYCEKPGCQLYLREDRETTYDVSASECTVDCGTPQSKADFFLSATPSGEQAFFTSCAKLTDASSPQGVCNSNSPAAPWKNSISGAENGTKLYRWDRNQPPGGRLVDLTADHEPGDGVQPNFRGLIGESEDGETAFFVTAGQIVAGESTAFGMKLYRWRWNGGSPTVDYLGPYQPFIHTFEFYDVNWAQRDRTVTPDGRYLLIYSKLRLDPVADADADLDAYRWDEASGWTCVSCQKPGTPSAGDVDFGTVKMSIGFVPGGSQLLSDDPKYLMDDQGDVFFSTPDALVPEDVNGEVGCPKAKGLFVLYNCSDVYEYHDGTVSLLSSGTGSEPVTLISATPSGDDVFFYTRQQLVGWDRDLNIDIYDARRGGGFPEPPAEPPTCEGESCRGGGTTPAATTGAGSAVFSGPGNPTPQHKGTGKKNKHKKKSKKRHGKGKKSARKRRANSNGRAGR